jgi:type VI secretion system lysozyme-like protein
VREPKPISGARAPLFERLTDLNREEKQESRPQRVLDSGELRRSVRQEVSRLLNTRCATWEDRTGTVLDYGLPDFSWMSPASETDRQLLAATIARKVACFEPRLREVRVTIQRDETNPRTVLGMLEGVLLVESIREPVSFPLVAHKQSGEVAVGESSSAAYGS